MRDVERLKEKVEFSLDDRQIWALGLVALLLLAGVFTVGLLVGRRTAPEPAAAAGDLSQMDAVAKSRPAPAEVVHAVEKPEPAVPDAPPAEDKAEKPPRPPQKPAEEKVREAAVVSPQRPATVVQPAPQRAVQVASTTPVALTAPPRDPGEFTVQIGASQDRAEAQHMEGKARAAGLKPYAVEADLGKRGTWYRVRVGAFHDKEAANQFRRDVERELRSPAVVMTTR